MKRFGFISILVFLTVFLWLGGSKATTISFGDHAWFWPTWNNEDPNDQTDVIGNPDFLGGTVTIENGILQEIVINYSANGNYKPGDLFIDINADRVWDYFVNVYGKTCCGCGCGCGCKHGGSCGGCNCSHCGKCKNQCNYYTVYDISVPVDKSLSSNSYILSAYSSSGNYRDDHPIAIDQNKVSKTFVGCVSFSGWNYQKGSSIFASTVYSTVELHLPNQFTIGWTVECANDVIYETIPEPATFLLVGAAFLGVVVAYRLK